MIKKKYLFSGNECWGKVRNTFLSYSTHLTVDFSNFLHPSLSKLILKVHTFYILIIVQYTSPVGWWTSLDPEVDFLKWIALNQHGTCAKSISFTCGINIILKMYFFHWFSGDESFPGPSHNRTQASLHYLPSSDIPAFIMRKYYLTQVTGTVIKEAKLWQLCI